MNLKKQFLILFQICFGAGVVLMIWLAVRGLTEKHTRPIAAGWETVLAGENVNSVAITGETLWAGTNDGLYAIDIRKAYLLQQGVKRVSPGFVRDLLAEGEALWVVYDNELVKRDASGNRISFPGIHGVLAGSLRTILRHHTGLLWIGGEKGIGIFDGKTFARFELPERFRLRSVDVLFEDNGQRIWIGSRDSLNRYLLCYTGNRWRAYSTKDGMVHGTVNDIFQDESGKLWAALGYGSIGGVTFLHHEKWQMFNPGQIIKKEKIRTFFRDSTGRLFIGFEYDGLGIYDGENCRYYTEKDGLAGSEVRKILEDSDGNYWIATNRGLTRVQHGNI